jgi:hypothetical protein
MASRADPAVAASAGDQEGRKEKGKGKDKDEGESAGENAGFDRPVSL